MSPLYRGGDILLYLSSLSSSDQFCVCAFSLSIVQLGGQTRGVDPMQGYCWPTVYGAEPTLAQYSVFDATLNVGQCHRRRANINPTLVSSSSYCMAPALYEKKNEWRSSIASTMTRARQ